ncbi:response regulator [Streptomyces lasiicapitis]|uniref:DNA-binding response regulator n=1 Tax=Streptomyces lasiicapitis TaxID=1923961 RepID=A0ABQ2LP14_9ACTN|nr:response regulator transcription factor [Streptomyces lasiicapitis]GGO41210.1 DNA-binding response regulator [Streptomyces lasiicapitis]
MSEPVTVLVVDDQELVREGIASLLGIQPGVRVVGTCADGAEAVEAAGALAPEVILMDVRMPGMDGVEAVTALGVSAPACRVVMLTTFDDEEYVVRALRAGAVGYLLKSLPAAELAAAVRLARTGVTQLDASVTRRLAESLTLPEKPTTPANPPPAEERPVPQNQPLPENTPPNTSPTPREIEILRLVAAGATNREIAGRLFLSEGTVKNHISRILTRLGLRGRAQAALYARDQGLL